MTKKKVNKESIIEVALELLHEKGLSQLTMRNIAAKLHVQAPALYWYIKNKQELLQLLSEHISSQIKFPSPTDNWEEEVILLSLELRSVMLSISDGAEIMMDTLPTTPMRLHLINKTLEIFHRANFPEDKVFLTVSLINNYVTSYALDEQKQKRMVEKIGLEEIGKQFSKAITSITREEIPYVYKHILSPKGKMNDEHNFLAGLQIIIKGIKEQIK
ncbi:TetR/AcrR family transcriptional regulator C-terminal domain-containing protein [Psychrobacillus sp. NPDC058041]|uniref:TetR/AcrR family transcriptional regulator C-terminal domain-containing protein n=1 Tax=Psychrobacillus sp. NPDC058041 TaxID=3346310 RepID=UPI0036DCF295